MALLLRFFLLVCLLLTGVVTSAAAAGKRVALVVGMAEYDHCPKLANPRRDAAGMVDVLSALGFHVIPSLDQDLSGLTEALDRFYAEARGAEAALFYYAGHGLQLRGVNYLVPRDARLRSETRLGQETIALQGVVMAMEEKARIALVFLDACRDNPLGDELKRSVAGGERSAAVARGLAPMSIRNPDTMVVFATAPNATAQDGQGGNSPFAGAMLRHLSTPGVEIELMMKRVTRDVVQATGGAQVPERLSRLTSEFVFKEAAAVVGAVPAPVAADPCRVANPPLSCLWRNVDQ